MMGLIFGLVLASAFISLAVCIIRYLICFGAEIAKHDDGDPVRKAKYRSIGIHFLITLALFFIAAKLSGF